MSRQPLGLCALTLDTSETQKVTSGNLPSSAQKVAQRQSTTVFDCIWCTRPTLIIDVNIDHKAT